MSDQKKAATSLRGSSSYPARLHPDDLESFGPNAARQSPLLPDESEPLESATVARGRSVDMPSPGAKQEQTGFDLAEKRPVFRLPQTRYGPGQVVKLPRSEVRRLRALGFLVDPDAKAVAVTAPGPLV
jgi:hypothetical protein